MRTLRLLNLHCSKTDDGNDDNTKLNETFLTVENGRFHVFGPESMMDGSIWNIQTDIKFKEKAIIGFFDGDAIRNLSNTKHFRRHIVEENEIHDGPKKVSFATNSINCVLTYEII
jgi:hypothetical protein